MTGRLLAWLVRLFPADFRERFGADLLAFLEDARAYTPRRSRWSASGDVVLSALDLAWAAAAEHVRPARRATHPPSAVAEGMEMTMSNWMKDLRFASRALRRTPGFTIIALGTLALALGVNAGIFSVVDSVLLEPLPYVHQDRLVHIAASAPGSDLPSEFPVAPEFYLQYKDRSKLLDDVGAYATFTSTLRAGDRTERPRMAIATPSLFTTLGANPVLGRLPVREDEDRVAVISYKLWMTWFDGDPDVVGRSYYISGRNRTVIAVMGQDFWFPEDEPVLWMSQPVREADLVPGSFQLELVGRMAQGVSRSALVGELGGLALQLPERFDVSASYAKMLEQHRAVVRPLSEQLVGGVSRPLWVLLGAVGIVLLIACTNVANLFLVRAEQRQRELAVRRAVGAGRAQLIRAMMTEAIVVAAIAGTLALAIAGVSVPLFVRAAPANLPRLGEIHVSGWTLLFTLGASILSALLCGLVPALRASSPKLTQLREGHRGATRRRHWGRAALVVAQTALALLLLIGSALLLRSFFALRHVDPGYDTTDVFTFQIAPEGHGLVDVATYARFHLDFMDRIAALPGVESVGVVENVPLNEGTAGTRVRLEGSADEADDGALAYYTFAGGDYFQTMRIELLRGRVFTDADQTADLGTVVVSKSAANLLWPGEDPIARRFQLQGQDSWKTVVGVVDDVLQDSFRDAPQPLIYLSLMGMEENGRVVSSPAYVVRSPRADHLAPEIRALVHEVAPEAPMYRTFTMQTLVADSMIQLSFTMLTLGVASALALFLGLIGLYGVLSSVVAERTREIGVRMALGAEALRVQAMVVAQGARGVALGIAIGLVIALATTRVLGRLLFGVEAVDLLSFAATAGAMALMGILASYVPARRASSVDPIRSLRIE